MKSNVYYSLNYYSLNYSQSLMHLLEDLVQILEEKNGFYLHLPMQSFENNSISTVLSKRECVQRALQFDSNVDVTRSNFVEDGIRRDPTPFRNRIVTQTSSEPAFNNAIHQSNRKRQRPATWKKSTLL